MERRTAQRSAIYENVISRKDHPTAMDVYDSVRASMPSISLTTVYRNLNCLADDGLITRITVANMPDRFDSTTVEHCHVACDICGSFNDYFDRGSEDTMKQLLKRETGFTVTKCDIVFRGVCKDCLNKTNH